MAENKKKEETPVQRSYPLLMKRNIVRERRAKVSSVWRASPLLNCSQVMKKKTTRPKLMYIDMPRLMRIYMQMRVLDCLLRMVVIFSV